MATKKQTAAAKKNVRKAEELYDIAKERQLQGRSKMGRDELAHALGYK
jgi:hypothetical protein